MPDLCSACGVEPAKPRMRICRFCDTTGWRPAARADASADPDEPVVVSPWWDDIASGLCVLAFVLIIAFLRLMP
jgi:hypothetical protein